jgi:hypothetical protein
MAKDEELHSHTDILERLYGAAYGKLMEMSDAITKDVGYIQIVTTNRDYNDFMQEDFVDVYLQKDAKKNQEPIVKEIRRE